MVEGVGDLADGGAAAHIGAAAGRNRGLAVVRGTRVEINDGWVNTRGVPLVAAVRGRRARVGVGDADDAGWA
jgi:hypothetical protein